jgi:hypothetical protein
MQAIMEAMQQRGGGRGGGTPREQEQPMTLDVHAATNSLIVNASEALFLEVKAYVEAIDEAASQQVTITENVKLDHVTTAIAQQSLENLLGPLVTIRANRAAQGSTSGSGSFGGMGGSSTCGGARPGGTFGGGGGGGPTFGGGGSTNPFMNLMGNAARPGGTFGGGSTFGGGTGSPVGGGGRMQPGGTFGGGTPGGTTRTFGGGTGGTTGGGTLGGGRGGR